MSLIDKIEKLFQDQFGETQELFMYDIIKEIQSHTKSKRKWIWWEGVYKLASERFLKLSPKEIKKLMENKMMKFRAKRLNDGRWVEGCYFKTPLTDEDSGATQESGWFFLSDGRERHIISTEHGVCHVVDPKTIVPERPDSALIKEIEDQLLMARKCLNDRTDLTLSYIENSIGKIRAELNKEKL